MPTLLLGLLAIAPLARPAPPQAADDPLRARAEQVAALVAEEPSWPEDLFDPAFLKQVPPAKLREIGRQYHAMTGAFVSVDLDERRGRWEGRFRATGEKDAIVPISLTLSDQPPHAVVGLWFGVPEPAAKSLEALVAELGKLPGQVSFAVCELEEDGPRWIATHEPDRVLGIGSTFKLWILAELVAQVNAGARRPDEVVRLEPARKSLPSGQMQGWPDGTPVTLSTLAAMMISISDNTATDHLLFALGREKVEARLADTGCAEPARNVPFLSTAELFKLKLLEQGRHGERYLERDVAGRRELLGEIAARELAPEDALAFTRPLSIDRLEWFASAADLCRAMDWLRRRTEGTKAAALREVLAINRGLSVSKEAFPWAGYKGGSEPGVLNLTFLLRDAEGAWFAASIGWNDATEALDESKLMGSMTRALYLLGRREPAAEPK